MLQQKGLKQSLKKLKVYTSFRPSIFSRHPSHSRLRRELPLMPFRSCIRFGSTTESIARIQINSVEGVKNSSNKKLMKKCFTRVGVKTAQWWTYSINDRQFFKSDGEGGEINLTNTLPYPIVSKSLYGSRGEGNAKHDTQAQLEQWIRGKDLSGYIFEKFQPLGREYRLHITQEGCFYACRKLLLSNQPQDTWQLHDEQVSWALETNPSFKKPGNWNEIVADCVKAQRALGLDICAFDVLVSPPKANGASNWLICESCSAPSFGEVTLQKYLVEIPKVLKRKYELSN